MYPYLTIYFECFCLTFHVLTSVGRKNLQYVSKMLPRFRAVVKFYSTYRLFTLHQNVTFTFYKNEIKFLKRTSVQLVKNSVLTSLFLHFISFHFISFHFISFHFISFHFIFTSFRRVTLQHSWFSRGPPLKDKIYIQLKYNNTIWQKNRKSLTKLILKRKRKINGAMQPWLLASL